MDVFYRHSSDGGKSWSLPVNLSNSFAGSVKPQVRVGSGNKVYVTWEEGEDWYLYKGYPIGSMYAFSSDGGNSWEEPFMFSSDMGPPQQMTLGLAKSGDLVVVWRVPDGERFDYQLSQDNGATWSDPEPIPGVIANEWKAFSLYAYDTATDSAGNVHLLVLGYLYPTDENLALIHLIWDGTAWSSPNVIYASSDPPEWGRIDIGAGNQVYATWFSRDAAHIFDTENALYKIWASFYRADAPALTPAPPSTAAPNPTPSATSQEGVSTVTPTPIVIAPGSSGLPPGTFTESDDVLRLLAALLPTIALLLIIVVLRFLRTGHRR
jgi:hypothetical protein